GSVAPRAGIGAGDEAGSEEDSDRKRDGLEVRGVTASDDIEVADLDEAPHADEGEARPDADVEADRVPGIAVRVTFVVRRVRPRISRTDQTVGLEEREAAQEDRVQAGDDLRVEVLVLRADRLPG